jgi:hypothetical protein
VSRVSRVARLGAVTAMAAALLVPTATVAAHSPKSRGHSTVRRIFVIMLENHSQSTVIGDPNAPFINKLVNTYGEATNYYGVTHPSQPNYVAAITGQLDITRMNDHPDNTYDWTNLVDQLESHGKTWAAYMDSMPYAGYTGPTAPGNTALYTNKHNPFVLMSDVLSSSARLANIKPYTDMARDLNSRNAPDFVWISPNQCNDMHGGVYSAIDGHPETPCPYGSAIDDANDAALKQKADTFVKNAVRTIRRSKAWTANSAIFILTDESDYAGSAAATDEWLDVSGCCDSPGYGIAPALPPHYQFQDNCTPDNQDPPVCQPNYWDEGQFGGGLIPAIVVTRHGPRHVKDSTPYNHYSLLRTIEQVWHLGYLGYAADGANVSSMTHLLQH